MSSVQSLPKRSEVDPADTWDLSSLFASNDAWEEAFRRWERDIDLFAPFRGSLGRSAERLAEALTFDNKFERAGECIGSFAYLKESEDAADGEAQARKARYLNVASRASQAASFFRPEILAIPDETMKRFLDEPVLAEHRLTLERLLRYKPHTLGEREERLLAMQTEMAQAANQAFTQLTNADMKFGEIDVEPGRRIELTHGSFSMCLHHPDRNLRRAAFHQYYTAFADHSNTLAATLAGAVHKDVYYARVRDYPSAREMGLFDDNVPVAVYDNLIEAVHANLPALFRYYAIRKRAMNLDAIHHFDTYVPILSDLQTRYEWDAGVELVLQSLHPLGAEYGATLSRGLRGRWCDRFENKGKRSGAFSSGSFDGDPFILMNYQPEVLDHVFTLAHEAGHSMHTHYSANNQPFQYYNYTIFVAEVASTFNEQLLSKHLLERVKSDKERAYFLNREIDAMRGTIFRQTMFAEFEKVIHALVENNEPLTLERFRGEYRTLLERYFGADFVLDDELSFECLRIPHFYRAFYVYKYATGMSAAIALAEGVTQGGPAELDAYLRFLKGGCSKFPLDLLRDAGVDMETPEPVGRALERFGKLVDELDRLV